MKNLSKEIVKMINKRDRELIKDYTLRVTNGDKKYFFQIDELVTKYKITPRRIYQILKKYKIENRE